ncbi:ABC transporter substrate-binding protein [Microbacterium karelineae]|uniref:ABC transporter substrate-binding protein n=1 Tax=Microbacterium karelineae TaxID=2654283 RepID=UPI0012EAF2D9|nr:ABC transporter substrate-binding protein [Microbacterium karelineae]
MTMPPRLSGRVLVGAAVLGVLAVSACSSDTEPSEPAGSDRSHPFSYTDARGTAVSLDRTPEVVVAQTSVAAALWDNGYQAAGVFGELPDPLDYQAGDIDPSQMTVLGTTWGEFSVEEYAALGPDLLIDMTFDLETLWYAGEVEGQITEVAPTIGMQLTGLSVTEQIEAFVDLAERLGAEPDIAEAKAEFEAAGGRVAEASEGDPELVVLALSVTEDGAWFANPAQHPDLAHLADLGVEFAEVTPDESGVWEQVSLENLGKHHADVLLVDARDASGLDAIRDMEIWRNLPAVVAGQQYAWYPAAPYSYESYANIIGEYADHLESAEGL